ncbi:uncharacterized protein LOC114355797 isoform X1 [Ostrinia furnacalis]|uniref:uncharacterized protein LOC114355797 isoform X1 n=1 Tax=Ostrinia furnacalis TaxID=93504 RepID=UPI00103CA363|nr:uncharacterized protein LOC114355797 isoform X1 [Ostrinia furnacalis]
MPISRCIIPGCPSTRETTMLHKFPTKFNMQLLWLKYILPYNPQLKSQTPEQLCQRKVCVRHFEAQYINKDNRRAMDCAPTLFTEEEMRTGIPTTPLPSKLPKILYSEHNYSVGPDVNFYAEHNYCKPDDQEQLKEFVNLMDDIANYEETNFDDPDDPIDEKRNKSKTLNEIQQYIDEFAKQIQQGDEDPPLEDVVLTNESFKDTLESYNFSSNIIYTNKELKRVDALEYLMYPERAYAAITFCILKQQALLEECIHNFVEWANKTYYDIEGIPEKIEEIFSHGNFMKTTFKILQIVCKYRAKNTEMRKEYFAKKTIDPKFKETLNNIPYTSNLLFKDDDLKNVLQDTTLGQVFKTKKRQKKNDRGIQVNILPKKSDKAAQVTQKKIRKASKAVQANTNELEGISTANKVKKKDTGSQTSDKDKLLGETIFYSNNPPTQDDVETNNPPPISHCQKIQYVVNIKRKPGVIKKLHKTTDSHNKVSVPLDHSNAPSQNGSTGHNRESRGSLYTDPHHEPRPKKRQKTTKGAQGPSMPLLWDACQNLLSLGGDSNIQENDERVHSTLEREIVPQNRTESRPSHGKKRRPKILEPCNEPTSPMSLSGTVMRGTISDFHIMPGKSTKELHVCDSPYLLGGCKHTHEQSENVSSIDNANREFFSRGGKLRRQMELPEERSGYPYAPKTNEVASGPGFGGPSEVVHQHTQNTVANNPDGSPITLLNYDNLPIRWV